MTRLIASILAALGAGAAVTISQAPSAGGSSGICNDAGVCKGTLIADAGFFQALSINGGGLNLNSSPITNASNVSSQNTFFAGSNFCLTAGGNSCIQDNGANQMYLNPITGVAGSNGIWQVDGGLTINAGTTITNIGLTGTCSIAAGTTCTATTTGSTSSSQCFFSQKTGTAVGCTCAAGASSTVITCPAATTGTFNVLTIN